MANETLLKILDGLGEEELERFKFFLKYEGTKDSSTIPKRKLENARTWDIVDLMIQAFPLPEAVEVTKRVLTKIPRNDLVKTLSDSSSGPKGQSQRDNREKTNSRSAMRHNLMSELLCPQKLQIRLNLSVNRMKTPLCCTNRINVYIHSI